MAGTERANDKSNRAGHLVYGTGSYARLDAAIFSRIGLEICDRAESWAERHLPRWPDDATFLPVDAKAAGFLLLCSMPRPAAA
jgi:hypothetical protein